MARIVDAGLAVYEDERARAPIVRAVAPVQPVVVFPAAAPAPAPAAAVQPVTPWSVIGAGTASNGDGFDTSGQLAGLTPAFLRSIGFSGPATVQQGSGESFEEVINPALRSFLDANALTVKNAGLGDTKKATLYQTFDATDQRVGDAIVVREANDDVFAVVAAILSVVVGGAIAGAATAGTTGTVAVAETGTAAVAVEGGGLTFASVEASTIGSGLGVEGFGAGLGTATGTGAGVGGGIGGLFEGAALIFPELTFASLGVAAAAPAASSSIVDSTVGSATQAAPAASSAVPAAASAATPAATSTASLGSQIVSGANALLGAVKTAAGVVGAVAAIDSAINPRTDQKPAGSTPVTSQPGGLAQTLGANPLLLLAGVAGLFLFAS